jgi:hypothetical protein
VITVGDDHNTPFWEARWLNGVAPKALVPNLYKQVQYKYRTIHKELKEYNWIKNIKHINSETLMDEFILLFITLSDIHLTYTCRGPVP